MKLTENVPLSSLTTFKIGGNARYVAECSTDEDLQAALAHARECGLPWYVMGGGSNLLIEDVGYDGVIIRPLFTELVFAGDSADENICTITAGAGIVWDALVQESVTRGLWGLENLAGIPGLVGGAPVQNIGAYGADVSDTLISVDIFDTTSDTIRRFSKEECQLGYRDSIFKHDASLIITRVAFALSTQGTPHVNYADLQALAQQGESLDTPEHIAAAVREIRSKKFPDLAVSGTAGSFFKNPFISKAAYAELQTKYPELPGFPSITESGSETVKIPLAWILDHVLDLRGFSKGPVRLFERQPLVLVSETGATRHDVEMLAEEVERKVKEATGISIEREVRMLM